MIGFCEHGGPVNLQVAQNPGNYWEVLGSVKVLGGGTVLCGVVWGTVHSMDVPVVVFPYLSDV